MKTIAVIFGGQSAEHDVSIVTAISSIIKPLELTKMYKVVPVYVSKNGSWYSDNKFKNINTFTDGTVDSVIKSSPKLQILINNGLTLIKPSKLNRRKNTLKIDIVFPSMHGTHGEDGDLMGLLEMTGVTYVGCGVAASAIAMDKIIAKQVTGFAGIASTPWVWATSAEYLNNSKEVLDRIKHLKYPLFVKPAHLGSSIGITKVNDYSGLVNALEVAMHFDDKIIIEQGVSNLTEVTLPIIGNQKPIPAFLEQPQIKSEEFFDFETKYMQGGKGGKKGGKNSGSQGYSTIPAQLDVELYNKAEALGLAVYKTVGCTGIARVDMLIDSLTREVFFNEINPMPGGLYAHNWQKKGINKIQLVTSLVNYAEESSLNKNKLQTSFNTNYLKQF